MSAHFNAWVYGEVQGLDPGSSGGYPRVIDYTPALSGNKSFPAVGTVFHPLSPAQTIGGVSCNSIVEVLPTGSHNLSRRYVCDATVQNLNSGAS